MSSNNPSFFILPTDRQFDGTNWTQFKTNILNAAKARGLIGYLDGTITKPKPPASGTTETSTTYWGSATPTLDEWLQRDSYAQGMISLNVIDPVGQGLNTDGTAAETWKSLTVVRDAKSDLALLHAEEELTSIKYTEGNDIEAHFANMRNAQIRANNQGAGITDRKFRMYILKSMPKSWSPVVGTLFSETTSAAVINRLVNHALLTYGSSPAVTTTKSPQALATQTNNRRPRNPDKKCTNPVCGRSGHLITECFKPGGSMEGQYPDWWRGTRAKNTSTTPTTSTPSHCGKICI